MEELSDELSSLNMEHLSKVSGLPTWRLRDLVKQGKGPPHFRVGTTYRFPVTAVRKWYADLTSTSKEDRAWCRVSLSANRRSKLVFERSSAGPSRLDWGTRT